MPDWMDELYKSENRDTFSTTTTRPPDLPRATSPNDWGVRRRDPDPFFGPVPHSEPKSSLAPEVDCPRNSDNVNNGEEVKTGQTLELEPDEEGEAGEQVGAPGKKTFRDRVTSTRDGVREGVEGTEPVPGKVPQVREHIDPRNFTSIRWSFLWATAASWAIGPQFLVALWDRTMRTFGQNQMMSGPEPMDFGLLNGPGRWFRDQVGHHWENGSMEYILVCAAFGIVPLILVAAANTWSNHARLLLGAAILGPVVYMIGVSYLGWTLTVGDLYLVTLFALAWYCTWWFIEKKEPSFTRFLLMIPLASVISGALLYSPGAAF